MLQGYGHTGRWQPPTAAAKHLARKNKLSTEKKRLTQHMFKQIPSITVGFEIRLWAVMTHALAKKSNSKQATTSQNFLNSNCPLHGHKQNIKVRFIRLKPLSHIYKAAVLAVYSHEICRQSQGTTVQKRRRCIADTLWPGNEFITARKILRSQD